MLDGVPLLNEDLEVQYWVNPSAVRVDDKSKVDHGLEYIGCVVVESKTEKCWKSLSEISRRTGMSFVGGYGLAEQRPVWFVQMLCRS
jgi:hypothetical protein